MTTLKLTLQRLLISDLFGNIVRVLIGQRVRFYDAQLSLRSKAIRGRIVSLLFFKKYEKEEIFLIKGHLRKDLPVIDLGASIGAISTNVALSTNQPLLCVEASPTLAKIVERNLLKNDISPERFTVVQSAIAPHSETGKSLHFLARGSNELGKLHPTATAETIEVPALSLKQLRHDHQVNEYILISDIEGAETAFLFDHPEQLNECKQLFIELHPAEWNGTNYSILELRARIIELGFTEVMSLKTNYLFERHEKS